eukprot:CAMPEP_0197829470 /NCGR_PEP_ID=MMETSP1437-20131217/5948_1 /TAXON_ID=49252 ORGANISM="Eucampia antarctica, Strain CCMP1452" /NCGR_SAMPLE_ID=MMETSP1437 /ASSEMBLY_ACC=CAM_ASM_001096 /LENGTH=289 /DNA_ID=CAMNT_0043431183 /DNA_START=414 /DNA_END=1283 /DNA_ORIENTATION=+
MTMMMGEMGSISGVSEEKGVQSNKDDLYEIILVVYGFIVVIVLSNMLIAITTDSYAFIKNERAVMVFWSNRLDQVAENYAFVAILRKLFRCEKKKEVQLVGPTTVQENPGSKGIATEGGFASQTHRGLERVLYDYWELFLDIFSDNMEARSRSYFSFDFLLVLGTRLLVIVIIPIWLLVGLATLTILWPPQIREMCLSHEMTATSNNTTDEVLWKEFDDFKSNMKIMQRRLQDDMKIDRVEIDELSFEVFDVQKNVVEDMVQVKEVMTSLLDMMKNQLDRRDMNSNINY